MFNVRGPYHTIKDDRGKIFCQFNAEVALWSGDTDAALSIPPNEFALIYATGGSKERTEG